MVTGPATVIEAIAQGKKAAQGIDKYINKIRTDPDNDTVHKDETDQDMDPEPYADIPSNTPVEPRVLVQSVDPDKRVRSFEEVEVALAEEQALNEAERCLNCATCCECMECITACEAKAINHFMKEETIQINAGSIILATGYDTLDPTPIKQFGYDRFPNVFSAMQPVPPAVKF